MSYALGPLAIAVFVTLAGRLTANPIEDLTRRLGQDALLMLTLSLAISPVVWVAAGGVALAGRYDRGARNGGRAVTTADRASGCALAAALRPLRQDLRPLRLRVRLPAPLSLRGRRLRSGAEPARRGGVREALRAWWGSWPSCFWRCSRVRRPPGAAGASGRRGRPCSGWSTRPRSWWCCTCCGRPRW